MTFSGAENGTRTRDLNLGKVALYQLSYFRKVTLYQLSYFRKVTFVRLNPYEWTAKLVKFYLTPKIFLFVGREFHNSARENSPGERPVSST